jgi:hypothetical protein
MACDGQAEARNAAGDDGTHSVELHDGIRLRMAAQFSSSASDTALFGTAL